MRNYDEVKGFIDYTNKDEWREYIESYVIPLWKYSWILKEYWEELKNEFDGLPFDEVKEEERPLLLGGIVQGDEIYTRNSLAKFYAKFFGMRLKDIQAWILHSQTGETLTDINVEVVETGFINFVKKVFELLDYGLSYQKLVTDFKEPELDYEELKRDPNKVKEIIKNFYQAILNISLNYNYGTFFLCSINQITYRYMKAAYPRIDEVLDFLKNEFGLTELRWNNPIKPNTKTYRDYTIYCFPEYDPNNKGKSFGGAICVLNDLIWEEFLKPTETKEALSMLFGSVPNLYTEFKEKIKGKIPEIYFDIVYCKENLMCEAYKKNIWISYTPEALRYEKSYTVSLLDVLDQNSPHLFLNMLRIDRVSKVYSTYNIYFKKW